VIHDAVIQNKTIKKEGLRIKRHGKIVTFNLIARRVEQGGLIPYLIFLCIEDITEKKTGS